MNSTALRILVAVIGLIAIGALAYNQLNAGNDGKVRRIRGEVLSIDAAARQAAIEFTHPRSGKKLQITGQVSPECSIRIGEQPATLADVRVGDTAIVEGTLARGRVTATSVEVERAVPASDTRPAPASQPTAERP